MGVKLSDFTGEWNFKAFARRFVFVPFMDGKQILFSSKESMMAKRINAIAAFRPRIDKGNTVRKAELVRALARATGLNESTVDLVIDELRDHLVSFCRMGRAVKIDGLGTYTPGIRLDGVLQINYRPDPFLNKGLNLPGTFTGTVINNQNVGKTSDDLVDLWNTANPSDLVQ